MKSGQYIRHPVESVVHWVGLNCQVHKLSWQLVNIRGPWSCGGVTLTSRSVHMRIRTGFSEDDQYDMTGTPEMERAGHYQTHASELQ